MPNHWMSMTWMVMSTVTKPGRTATWKPKKRVSVAPVTSGPPRRKIMMGWPTTGTWATMSVPTLVAKNASVFQGSR
jgi:hypothetical protein